MSVGCSGVAFAEDGKEKKPKGKRPKGPEGIVLRLDKDENGELSVAELAKMKEEQRTKILKRADGNSDGALDKAEIAKWKEKAAKAAAKKKKEEKEKEGGEKKEGE